MSRILIVSDAWSPQVNGVVRCLQALGRELVADGDDVQFLTPQKFWTVPMPTYPEIRLSVAAPGTIAAQIAQFDPDHIHIATEGPLGLLSRFVCLDEGLRFTSSYHTRFPEYLSSRFPVPPEWVYAFLRWFHASSSAVLVPTPSMHTELADHGFERLVTWTRGVDQALFHPGPKSHFLDLPGPHILYVGRVAVEKNISSFLSVSMPGTKIVVGDGPQLAELRQRFPDVVFLGLNSGEELSAIYRSADLFVFPSKTDTFGNTILEALASGVPVAAFPVTGPIDILTDPSCGALDDDLELAIRRGLTLSREAAQAFSTNFTWAECANIFRSALVTARPKLRLAA